MRFFKLRPLALGCFLFLLSMYSAYFLGNIFSITLLALAVIALVSTLILYFKFHSERYANLLIYILPLSLCLIIAAISSLSSFSNQKRNIEKYVGTEQVAEIRIIDINYSQYYETSAIGVLNADKPIKVLFITSSEQIEIGDTVRASVTFRELSDSANGYNEKEYYIQRAIYLCAESDTHEIISSGSCRLRAMFKRINEYLCSLVEKSVNSDTSSLICAMLLGNRASLGDDVKRDFATLGITHILALSGIHISLIAGMFDAFLTAIRLKKGIRYALLTMLISLFVCITGFASSAMRAAIMLFVFYTLYYFGKRSDMATSLFVSVMLICAFLPYSIFSTSLILSFCAMLGCISSTHFTRKVRPLYRIRPKFLRKIVYTLITTVTVMVFTLPIIYIKFDSVSVFSPFFNIIFVPILSILLYLSPLLLMLGQIPYVCYVIKIPTELITHITLFLTRNIAKAKFLVVPFTNSAHTVAIAIVIVAIVTAMALPKKKVKYSLCILGAGVLLFTGASLFTVISRTAPVSINASTYRSADRIAIESQNELILIEASSPTASSAKASLEIATELGYTDVSAYILCDYGRDTLSAIELMSNSTYLKAVMLPPPKDDSEKLEYSLAQALLNEKGITLSEIPSEFELNGVSVCFMDFLSLPRSTKRCVAFTVTANNSRYTYLGASTYECIDYFPLDYLKASDAVVFGSYGPSYKIKYKYDLEGIDCLTFLGESAEYCDTAVDTSQIVLPSQKIKFK